MMNKKEILKKVSEKLSEDRFLHSVAVAETAEKLALQYGADAEKAFLAGILHDVGKQLSLEEMQELVYWPIQYPEEWISPDLLHSQASAAIAEKEFGITDREILDAIRRHTVGGANLSLLEKILYLADYIAPGRMQPGVDKVRDLAERDLLDQALLAAYEGTLDYLTKNQIWIHPDSVEGMKECLGNLKERRN